EFTTKSRVIIISNDWRTLNNSNASALLDRGHVIVFEPDVVEVHHKAGEWFTDREIYSWFAENLHRVPKPSFRYYVRAKELKSAGLHWKGILAVGPQSMRERLAADIMESDSYQSTNEKVEAFVLKGGGCRATFFNYKRKLGIVRRAQLSLVQ